MVTIPVVFHILYHTESENISVEKLQRELHHLNLRFRKLNSDTSNIPDVWADTMADAEIEFCLATTDPKGLPHNGIERRWTPKESWLNGSEVVQWDKGGLDTWNRDAYLNIWICKLANVGGYGTYPGGSPIGDGIICTSGSIGQVARVSTHEVGHWLDLRHIWGPCPLSDGVADTPPQARSSRGCPTFPALDACSDTPPGKMFMNYMDYSSCVNSFTKGQVAQMHAALSGPRAPILQSDKCTPVQLQSHDVAIGPAICQKASACRGVYYPVIEVANIGDNFLYDFEVHYQLDQEPAQSFSWDGLRLRSLERTCVALPGIPAVLGSHTLLVWLSSPNGQVDPQPGNNWDTLYFTMEPSQVAHRGVISERFEGFSIFDNAWTLDNPDFMKTWGRESYFDLQGNPVRCLKMDNFNYRSTVAQDHFVLPLFDPSSLPFPRLAFDLAYQLKNPGHRPDTLKVQVSTDCGQSWTSVYRNWSLSLTTARNPYGAEPFVPAPWEWRTETVDLSAYQDLDELLLRFSHTSMGGNDTYLDNVFLGIDLPLPPKDQLILSPNPVTNRLRVVLPAPMADWNLIKVYDAQGQVVKEMEIWPTTPIAQLVEVADLSQGIYFLEVVGRYETLAGKFVKLPPAY